VDHEDVADDSLQEANKRNEAMEPGSVNGNLNGAYVLAGNAEGFPANSEDNMRDRVEELSIGLQQCIVNSILSIGPLKTCDPRIRISNQIVVYQFLHMAALVHTIRACRLRLKVGLHEMTLMTVELSLTRSLIVPTGRMDLQKKLFASIQLVGGVALTKGLVDAIEERYNTSFNDVHVWQNICLFAIYVENML
jgi:hypothetical protein